MVSWNIFPSKNRQSEKKVTPKLLKVDQYALDFDKDNTTKFSLKKLHDQTDKSPLFNRVLKQWPVNCEEIRRKNSWCFFMLPVLIKMQFLMLDSIRNS